jgi:hypothetical protein
VKSGLVDGPDLVKVCGGYEQGAAQTDFLRRMGLNPFPGRDGHPVITWEAVTEAMTRRLKERATSGARPDFAALRKTG